MDYQVEVRDVDSILLASARDWARRENLGEKAMAISGQAWEFLRSHPEIPQPGVNVWLYSGERSEAGFSIQAGAQVLEPFESDGPVVCVRTPEGRVAVVTHMGPYEKIPEAYQAFHAWIEREGLALAGPSWEVYGHWDEDPTKLRTDIYHLLA